MLFLRDGPALTYQSIRWYISQQMCCYYGLPAPFNKNSDYQCHTTKHLYKDRPLKNILSIRRESTKLIACSALRLCTISLLVFTRCTNLCCDNKIMLKYMYTNYHVDNVDLSKMPQKQQDNLSMASFSYLIENLLYWSQISISG